MKRIPCLLYLLMNLTIALAKGASTVDTPQDPLQITLNGLKIAINRETGGVFSTRTARLKPLDLAIYEFIAE
jgi:hypothetical protein